MLWGSFRGCAFIEKTQKSQWFWTLSTLLPAYYSPALLLLSQSGASQKHQMSIPEAHLCQPSVQQDPCTCVCSNITKTREGQKIHQVLSISSLAWVQMIWRWLCPISWISPKEEHVLPVSCWQPGSKASRKIIMRSPGESLSACSTCVELWFGQLPPFEGDKEGTSNHWICVPVCLWRSGLCLKNLIPLNSPLTAEKGNCIL